LNSGGLITASSTGAGNAGSVTLGSAASPAQSVLIDGAGSGIVTDTHGTGAGGDIGINASTVAMTNGAAISADSLGTANAGNITITATNGLSMRDSKITTLVPPSGTGTNAGGGDIKITTSPGATVYLQDSTISASVADGHGGGGNISIDPQFVILNNSQILARADQGQGGSISIIAGLFVQDVNSLVNADSGRGLNGTVTIQSPISPASGKIVPLSQKPLIPTSLLSQRCAALAGGNFSSFTVAGRDSLPAEPGGWLSSPLAVSLSESGGGTLTEAGPRANLSEPAGEIPLLSLRQIAPPGFLTQAFAVDGSAGCQS
jgi:large exoprotein involved in heme utilization and adhesion